MRGLNNADSIQEKNRKSTLCQKIENRKIENRKKIEKSTLSQKIENRKSKSENRKSNFFWSQPASQFLFPEGKIVHFLHYFKNI